MVSDAMAAALNTQMEREAYASFLYLAMAAWLENEGLEGCSKFMYRQADEEKMHMMRIFNYMVEMDKKAIVPAISKPPESFESVKQLFQEAYTHEQSVTSAINTLVNQAIKENDHTTHNFLQWYVEEQREEETLMRTILDKIGLIGDGPQCLYFIDKELEDINASTEGE
jgi:ferritin